ncbi:MAG: hypothetical protein ACP5KY_02690 [Thermoproteus sp.]
MSSDWTARFIADAGRLFGISADELAKFADAMAKGDERAVAEWAERNKIGDRDFLVLSTMYILYKTEDKVSDMLEGLELRVDEAVAFVGSLTAQLVNGLGADRGKALLAQILLAAALQIEDKETREKMAEFAGSLL